VLAGALLVGACSGGGDDDDAAPGTVDSALDPVQPTTVEAPTGCEQEPARNPGPAADAAGPSPFNGLGTWIDVFDFVPEYASDGLPSVVPAHVQLLADLGVRTIYLQAARNDDSGATGVVAHELVGEIVDAAHERGLCVVAWYLPRFEDVQADLTRLTALRDFRTLGGDGFDGVGVDIEWTQSVPLAGERSERLVELSVQARAALADLPLAAIVPPPVQIEVINPDFWPGFPWARIAPSYDVWMPMTYWTFRSEESGYRDAYAYTEESVRRLRTNVGDPDALVHPIGGIGDLATDVDYRRFLLASDDVGSVGVSIYDFRTTGSYAWVLFTAPPSPTPTTTTTVPPTTAPTTAPTTVAPTTVAPTTVAPGATTVPGATTTVPGASSTAATTVPPTATTLAPA
jgi:hypothetical protein